jgi:hypothetical protein
LLSTLGWSISSSWACLRAPHWWRCPPARPCLKTRPGCRSPRAHPSWTCCATRA